MSLENVPSALRVYVADAIIELTGGDTDGILVCTEMVEMATFVSLQRPASVLDPIYYLDYLGIRDGDIRRLYEMCCSNIVQMMVLLRGVRLRFVTKEELKYAIGHNGEGINLSAIICKVQASHL